MKAYYPSKSIYKGQTTCFWVRVKNSYSKIVWP